MLILRLFQPKLTFCMWYCNIRKKLNRGPLLYVHLNLSVALLLALLVLVCGIETATSIRVSKYTMIM